VIRATRQWDVRCPDALKLLLSPRKGYWFKVSRDKAQQICDILSAAYGIRPLVVQKGAPTGTIKGLGRRPYGIYSRGKMWMNGRSHIKTVFHEWYHHLDECTHGKYDSNDNRHGDTSFAWQFGDRMFLALKEPLTTSLPPSDPVD
jgi:hypothetical protein